MNFCFFRKYRCCWSGIDFFILLKCFTNLLNWHNFVHNNFRGDKELEEYNVEEEYNYDRDYKNREWNDYDLYWLRLVGVGFYHDNRKVDINNKACEDEQNKKNEGIKLFPYIIIEEIPIIAWPFLLDCEIERHFTHLTRYSWLLLRV